MVLDRFLFDDLGDHRCFDKHSDPPLLERRMSLSRLMRVEILCVKPEVVGHKRGNKIVAVIIAVLHPNVDRVVRGVTGRRDQWRLELFV